MNNFYRLDQIQASDRSGVGETAFHLSQLRYHQPVIPSLVVSAGLFQAFLHQVPWPQPLFADLASSSLYLNPDNPRQLRSIAQQIRHHLTSAALPPEWVANLEAAVQSWQCEAVVFCPSILSPDTALNPIGLLDYKFCSSHAQDLAQGLKQAWAELFSARSLLYWQCQEIPLTQVRLAVLLQPLYPTIASGWAQLHQILDPAWVQGLDQGLDQTRVTIAATWGHPIAFRQGDVSPDLYTIDLAQGRIQAQQVGRKLSAYHWQPEVTRFTPKLVTEAQQQQPLVLEPSDLQQLIQISQRAQKQLGAPLMLEWSLCQPHPGGRPRFYITQALPQLWYLPAALPPRLPPSLSPSESSLAVAPLGNLASNPGSKIQGVPVSGGQVIGQAYLVQDLQTHLQQELGPGTILVAPHIDPGWLPLIKQAAGLITEQGGVTSHGAIIARELGIPAVVGVMAATRSIRAGDWLGLDGHTGEVHKVPAPGTLTALSTIDSRLFFPQPQPEPRPPALGRQPGHGPQLMLNLSQVSSLPRIKDLPVEGVGLLRSELMAIDALDSHHPALWVEQGRQREFVARMAAHLQQFAQAFGPRPVFYRSLDLRSHEFRGMVGGNSPPEANPILGLRGTFSYKVDPTLFDLELEVISQVYQAGYENVHLILPFVRTVEEFSYSRQRVVAAGLTRHAGFQLWIMAEVPSIVFLLADYVQAGVQGISIGSNDLTQLLLAVDRDRATMAREFDARHPAVRRAMVHLIQQSRQWEIPCSICGQAPGQYPDLLEELIQAGITSISVDLPAVEATYAAIHRAERRLPSESVQES